MVSAVQRPQTPDEMTLCMVSPPLYVMQLHNTSVAHTCCTHGPYVLSTLTVCTGVMLVCISHFLSDIQRETLLHFSARLGLARLTEYLLSLGGTKALIVTNLAGLTPADTAQNASHDALADLLRYVRIIPYWSIAT